MLTIMLFLGKFKLFATFLYGQTLSIFLKNVDAKPYFTPSELFHLSPLRTTGGSSGHIEYIMVNNVRWFRMALSSLLLKQYYIGGII